MKEFQEIARWLENRGAIHSIPRVETLPAPKFMMNGVEHVSFSTNNYLGLASHPRMIAKAREGLERYGVGNCESRLLGGDLEIYDALERKLAEAKGKDCALLFATGYLTNLGVLSSLVKTAQFARIYGYRAKARHSYAFFSDEFNHVSIREGIRLSGADRLSFRHLDLNHLDSLGARQDSCRLIHAAICCLLPMATTASRSGLRVTAVMGDQSRVRPVQRAG